MLTAARGETPTYKQAATGRSRRPWALMGRAALAIGGPERLGAGSSRWRTSVQGRSVAPSTACGEPVVTRAWKNEGRWGRGAGGGQARAASKQVTGAAAGTTCHDPRGGRTPPHPALGEDGCAPRGEHALQPRSSGTAFWRLPRRFQRTGSERRRSWSRRRC